MTLRVLSLFGTRPEAIKMAPVVAALERAGFDAPVLVSGQHREMLDQVLALFGIRPRRDLDLMTADQTLADLTARALVAIDGALAEIRPDVLLVHGDTTTTLAGSLAGFYRRIPVGHVEAGLRSGDRYRPFPEEINRRVTDRIASVFYAPTPIARENLLREGAEDAAVVVTGNTAVDALRAMADRLIEAGDPTLRAILGPEGTVIAVTAHRRESFGIPLERICEALLEIAKAHPEARIVYPVHPNTNVREPVRRILGGRPGIHLVEPVDYADFLVLLKRCALVLTDSGGVQEEAATLGRPVLVLRDVTERPEVVSSGAGRLVGTDRERIVATTLGLLRDPEARARMSRATDCFGDGRAAERIAGDLAVRFGDAPVTPEHERQDGR